MRYNELKITAKSCVINHTSQASIKIKKQNVYILYTVRLILTLKNSPFTPGVLQNSFNIVYMYYI